MNENPCAELKPAHPFPVDKYGYIKITAHPGSRVQWHMRPGASIPEGWKLHSHTVTLFQEHQEELDEDDPRVNPYQPDLARVVILEKL